MFKVEGDYRALYFLITKVYIFSIYFVFYFFFRATTIRFCAIFYFVKYRKNCAHY